MKQIVIAGSFLTSEI